MQRSFDDLGTPLHDVTFCVLDLETTGGSAVDCAITEIGAVKVRGGECLGTFQTLVNPGAAIPPEITVLTGITQAMVLRAPRIEAVLPTFLEFVGGAAVVGHNVRFDLSFLRAACERTGYDWPANPVVDTHGLAKRLVRDEVPNCRLGTLAERLRLDHRPSHRALDDALATADLLHAMIERASAWGVLGLDDLVSLPKLANHPQATKLRLTDGLPRSPGVYLFKDRHGRVLYVGKATNLRQRVRSYFSGDERRKVGNLLRETAAIDHVRCANPLEAAVIEVRLIHEHVPSYNQQSKLWQKYAYLKLTLGEAFPRLSVVKAPKDDGAVYVGPLASASVAKLVAEAIESVVPLRRCTADPRRNRRVAPCAPHQIGVAACPCAGTIGEAEYRVHVDRVVHGLTVDPTLLLAPLRERMHALAGRERFEEAADVRDRAEALAGALRRQRRIDALRRADTLVVEGRDGTAAELRRGALVRAWRAGDDTLALALDPHDVPVDGPIRRDHVDELRCVAAWLDDQASAGHIRLVHCDGELASPLPRVPSFQPRR